MARVVNTTRETTEFNCETEMLWTVMDCKISVSSKHFAVVIKFLDLAPI